MAVIAHQPPPAVLLSESELLRRINVAQHRANTLRSAGKLVPDFTAQGGSVRLYRPERVPQLLRSVHPV